MQCHCYVGPVNLGLGLGLGLVGLGLGSDAVISHTHIR